MSIKEKKEKILALLELHNDNMPLSTTNIAYELQSTMKDITKILTRLYREGKIEKVGSHHWRIVKWKIEAKTEKMSDDWIISKSKAIDLNEKIFRGPSPFEDFNTRQFFSFYSDGMGMPIYLNAEQRKGIICKGRRNPDSYITIADFFGYKREEKEKLNKLNKYTYNPNNSFLGKKIIYVFLVGNDDSKQILKWISCLDFKTIAPELIIKPVLDPLSIKPPKKLVREHFEFLKQWTLVWDSVETSVWNSIRAIVGASVWASVRDSVCFAALGGLYEHLAGPPYGFFPFPHVPESIRDSIRAAVWAYASSFFDICVWNEYKYEKNPYQPCIELWEMGLVPSFDGKFWRLRSKNGIEWKGKI
jgi:hypothetical protein